MLGSSALDSIDASVLVDRIRGEIGRSDVRCIREGHLRSTLLLQQPSRVIDYLHCTSHRRSNFELGAHVLGSRV